MLELLLLLVGALNTEDYQALIEDWWTWIATIPKDEHHPLLDPDGTWTMQANDKYNHQNVYFLGGSYNASHTRNITIPEGTPLFFPVLDGGYWYAPTDAERAWHWITGVDIYKEMKDKANIDRAYNWSATLDGKPLEAPRVTTSLFNVNYPDDTFYEYNTGRGGGSYTTLVDGYWVYLEPLSVGKHKLYFAADSPNYVTEAIVTLNVVPLSSQSASPKLVSQWWQWLINIPTEKAPLYDKDGTLTMNANNDTDVFFLTDGLSTTTANRSITIPYGKPVFFPVVYGGYAYFPSETQRTIHQAQGFDVNADLKSRAQIDKAKNLNVILDGKALEYKRITSEFRAYYPKETAHEYAIEDRYGDAATVVDGYWVYLPTLEKGHHLIYIRGDLPNFRTDVTYEVVVK